MAVKVVDASALAAVMFDEPEADAVAGRLRGATLAAPTLLGYEIVNLCVMQSRRHPDRRVGIRQAFSLYSDLTIEFAEIDHAAVLTLAEQSGLTGYDASYLWLAHRLSAELVTLDRQLARAATALR